MKLTNLLEMDKEAKVISFRMSLIFMKCQKIKLRIGIGRQQNFIYPYARFEEGIMSCSKYARVIKQPTSKFNN